MKRVASRVGAVGNTVGIIPHNLIQISVCIALWSVPAHARERADEAMTDACAQAVRDRPWAQFGINLVGPALGAEVGRGVYGRDYIYPDEASLSYYRSRNLRLIRVTFLWERLQPELFGPLDASELEHLETLLKSATARGMTVIIGPHNYARYRVNGNPELIGSDLVPRAAFEDLWRRVAAHFSAMDVSVIYELMNEPHDTRGSWKSIAQAAINAIRENDNARWIYAPGDGWSSARSWNEVNRDLLLSDPADHLVYAAHQYFDRSAKGQYERGYDEDHSYPEIGTERIQPFLDWLGKNGLRGSLTEFGVPRDDPRWLAVLDKVLAALSAAGVGGTYWAGGPWWGDYPLSTEPRDGKDSPVLSLLGRYASRCAVGK